MVGPCFLGLKKEQASLLSDSPKVQDMISGISRARGEEWASGL